MLHQYPIYNVSVCVFNELFDYIKEQLNALCIFYNISSCDADYKKLLIHCTVKACCDVVIEQRNTKLVFFVQPSKIDFGGTLDDVKVSKWFPTIIKSIQNNLPLKWYNSSHEFSYFQNLIYQDKGISFLHQLSNKQTKQYTFYKAHKFAQKYELTFLSRNYFNNLKMQYNLLNT